MPIVSSEIIEDSPQADGRRWITEQHVDQLGLAYEFRYLADADADPAGRLASRAAELDAELTAVEIAANLSAVLADGPAAQLTFSYSTQVQSIAAMAAQADALGPWQMVLLGQFLAAQPIELLTGLIGMSADQVVALQGTVDSVAATLATLRIVVGEIAAAAAQRGA